jgi:putative DNA primase/helicase
LEATVKLVGLRPNPRKPGQYMEKYFDISFKSHKDMLARVDEHIGSLHDSEHVNLFFTAPYTHEKRKLVRQDVIPFDLDKIDLARVDEYIECFFETFEQFDRDKTPRWITGNGIQLLVQVDTSWDTEDFFKDNREKYKFMCTALEDALKAKDLPCKEVDPSVFKPSQLLRYPGTLNDKTLKGGEITKSYMLYENLEPQTFSFDNIKVFGMETKKEDFVLTVVPTDWEEVKKECLFIKWAHEKPEELGDPQWYPALSQARGENGREDAHEMSKGHPDYTPEETDEKYFRTVQFGARTCKSMSQYSDICKKCPHYGKIVTPQDLRSKDFIRTKDLGYYMPRKLKDGIVVPNTAKPCYKDLVKAYQLEHKSLFDEGKQAIRAYKDGIWEFQEGGRVQDWAYQNLLKKHESGDKVEKYANDFLKHMTFYNKHWDLKANGGGKLIPFANGVLDVRSMQLYEYDPKQYMLYKLPHAWDPEATCPKYDSFLDEMLQGDRDKINLMNTYLGYALAGVPNWAHKALFLYGRAGSNGKSEWLKIVSGLFDEVDVGRYTLLEMLKEDYRAEIAEKRININAELSKFDLHKTIPTFKLFVSGEPMAARRLYGAPFTIKPDVKMFFAGNVLPAQNENTPGLFRRFEIVEFNYSIPNERKNPHLANEILATEASGIIHKCLELYLKIDKTQKWPEFGASSKALDRFKQESDPVQGFIDDCLNVTGNDEDYISSKSLFGAFKQWADDGNVSKKKELPTRSGFSQKIGSSLRTTRPDKKRINGKPTNIRRGLVMKEGWDEL